MKLTENTNYEAFAEFLKSECMHEAVYTDSEGRRILVIGLLDAFTMAHCWGVRMVRDERERIAAEWDRHMYGDTEDIDIGAAIRARGKG